MPTQAASPSSVPAPSSGSPKAPSPKEQLLDAAVAHVAAHGIADTSLRELASAIGTSHRMLIHHFGSKEALLVEIVRTMEQRQRDALAELRRSPSPNLPPGEILWRGLNDPALEPFERLFFEVYGQALQGRAWAAGLLDGVVDDWLAPIAELFAEAGLSTAATPGELAADARLALAVARGLLLDVLATGDRAAVDAAMHRFAALLTRR